MNWMWEAIQDVPSGEAAEVIDVNMYQLKADFHFHTSSKYCKEYNNEKVTFIPWALYMAKKPPDGFLEKIILSDQGEVQLNREEQCQVAS